MKDDLDLDGRGASVDPLEDPRLSAYVLGELAEDERRKLEEEMERRPELADEVRALEGVAKGLRSALGESEAPRLDRERRAEILRAASAPEERVPRVRPLRIAVAASVMVFLGAAGWFGTRALVQEADSPKSPYTYAVFGDTDEHAPLGYGGNTAAPSASPEPAAPRAEVSQQVATGEQSKLEALGYVGLDRASIPTAPQAATEIEDSAAFAESTSIGVGAGGQYGTGTPSAFASRRAGSVGRSTFKGGSEGAYTLTRDSVQSETPGTEAYDAVSEPGFRDPRRDPLSTFSIDVDTASYANVRRFLTQRQLPPAGAVRIEEMVNYFSYAYPEPRDKTPFSVSVDSASCPWDSTHRLVRIGLKGRTSERGEPRTKNLVFLVDVSGSMDDPAKLPLVQKSLRLLVNELGGDDRVALVVYAGNSGLVLPATPISERARILDAIDNLSAGGSTNGGQGIQLAYATAQEHFATNGVNRVILATDGDFNVGITDRGELLRLIEEKAKGGVFLSVLGFGTGNLKDATMEQLADHGNGNYAYVDTLAEARKVLVREMGATLETIAKDVKIQVEFNPARVGSWRLVGYENRVLAARDFNDDKKDAGEIGAGHTVTALYEIAPAGAMTAGVDSLKYQTTDQHVVESGSGELLTVKLRYKEPSADTSQLLSVPFTDGDLGFERAGEDLRFAAAVAAFGMCLRGSELRGSATLAEVHRWAEGAIGSDPHGDRREFLKLVDVAAGLSGR